MLWGGLKVEKQKKIKENVIATIFQIIGVLIFAVTILGGYVIAGGMQQIHRFLWLLALPWWTGGFVSGLFFYGIGEVIELLNQINQNIRSLKEEE